MSTDATDEVRKGQSVNTEENPDLELTEREKAIARGEDPDGAAEDEDVDGEGTEAEDEGTEAGGGSELGHDAEAGEEDRSEGGTDAAWVTDELKQLAASYNLTEDQLKEYGSEKAFRQAASAFDRQLQDGAGKPKEKPAEKSAKKADEESDEDEIDLDPEKFKEAGFDEKSLDIVRYAMRLKAELDELKPAVQGFLEQQKHQNEQREAWDFHSAVDQMDETRYGRLVRDGKVTQLNQLQDQSRRKLFEAAETLRLGIVAQAESAGQQPQVPPMPILLQRAEMLVFGEDIRQQEREDSRKRLKEQSKRRRPSPGRAKASAPPKRKDGDPVKEIANHPDVVAFWNQTQQDNGSD